MGDLRYTLPALKHITAKLHLVMGNHDKYHPSRGDKHAQHINTYTERTGAESITLTNTRLTLGEDTEVTVSHFPWQQDRTNIAEMSAVRQGKLE